MGMLKIQLLGEFRLDYNGALLSTVSTQRLQSLLAYLLIHRGAPQPRQRVAFLLWSESEEAQARGNLRTLLHSLREALPDREQFLSLDGQNLQWKSDAPYSLDLEEFEKAIAQQDSAESLEKAVSLYKGELLPGCYDEWILPERQQVEREFIGALERLIALLEAKHEYSHALVYADRLCAQDSLREDAYRKQMRLLGLMGDRAGVMRVYQNCKAVLKRELGEDVEPSPETQQAYEDALRVNRPGKSSPPGGIEAAPSPPLGPNTPSLPDGGAVWIRPAEPQFDREIMVRRAARALKPHLERLRDLVNYSVPVVVLAVLFLALHQSLLVSLGISVLVYLGLFFVLNPRTGREQANLDLRDDILEKLDSGRETTARIRRLQSRVPSEDARRRIARICDLSENVLSKLAADQATTLATAERLVSVLSETYRILDLYIQIVEGKVVAHPDNLKSSVDKVEQDLLKQIESFLLDFQIKLDQGNMLDVETSIRVMLERLKLEGLG